VLALSAHPGLAFVGYDDCDHAPETTICFPAITEHLHDLGAVFPAGTKLKIRYRPGFAASCSSTARIDISIDKISWSFGAEHFSPSGHGTYTEVFAATQDVRFVKVSTPSCFVDWSSAAVIVEKGALGRSEQVLDFKVLLQPGTTVTVRATPGGTDGCSGTSIIESSDNGLSWIAEGSIDYFSFPTPSPGWRDYKTTVMPAQLFRYLRIRHDRCFNDYSSAEISPYGYSEHYALIVGGQTDWHGVVRHHNPHYTYYWDVTSSMYHGLVSSYRIPRQNVYFLFEEDDSGNVGKDTEGIHDRDSTRSHVELVLEHLSLRVDDDDVFYLFWVSHGNRSSFALPGDDFAHANLDAYLNNIPGRAILAFHPCHSGCVIDDISRPGRVILTSVRCGETNSEPWAETWRDAILGEAAKNSMGDISIADAFEYAALRIQDDDEHPLLDDNGDGTGHRYDDASYDRDNSNEDGFVAARSYLGHFIAASDLVVQPVRVDHSSLDPGQDLEITATVKNLGTGNSAATTLRYYRSGNPTINRRDEPIGTGSVGPIAAGASALKVIAVSAPLKPGTYYVGACVDAVSGESETDNNCSDGERITVIRPAPDLVAHPVSVSDPTPSPGQSLTISWSVSNEGTISSANTTVRYYRSTNSTIRHSDTPLGTGAMGGITAGHSAGGELETTAPTAAGTYWFGICVDPVSGESDTGNNCSAGTRITVHAPDLRVQPMAVSDLTPGPNESFTITATVRNEGSGTSADTSLRYCHSTDSTISSSDPELTTVDVPGLSGGGFWAAAVTVTAPSTPGTYWIGGCVESVAGETDTGNNCSTGTRILVGAPDLVVDPVNVNDPTLKPGQLLWIYATVANRGSSRSAASILRYRGSLDPTIDNADPELGTDLVSGLNPGASSAESLMIVTPNAPGIYWVGACVDPVGGELNSANNCSDGVEVTISAENADLVVPPVTVSDPTLNPGQGFTIDATVVNQGGSRSAGTTLRYHGSFDPSIDTADPELGTDGVGALDPGASSFESLFFVTPDAPGTYWVGGCVDAVAGETNVGNNCSTGVQLTILAPDTPLDNGVPYDGAINSSTKQGFWRFFYVDLPPGSADLIVELDNLPADPPNDLDLYVRHGDKPTVGLYDCRPFNGGGAVEQCAFPAPSAGRYWIAVNNWDVGFIPYIVTASWRP
jgi:hypothetical protein